MPGITEIEIVLLDGSEYRVVMVSTETDENRGLVETNEFEVTTRPVLGVEFMVNAATWPSPRVVSGIETSERNWS